MNSTERFSYFRRKRLGIVLAAIILIGIGGLYLGFNLGLVDSYTLHLIVSWQMFFIIMGVYYLVKGHLTSGITLLLMGAFFLLRKLSIVDQGLIATYWPLILILAGIWILCIPFFKKKGHYKRHKANYVKEETFSKDGYVKTQVSFGSSHQIVLDACFKGASLETAFGSSVLDLRKTRLEQPETFIKVECAFGKVELFIPADWNVLLEMDSFCSDYNDKRYPSYDHSSEEPVLIIRGDLAFSGLEIKN